VKATPSGEVTFKDSKGKKVIQEGGTSRTRVVDRPTECTSRVEDRGFGGKFVERIRREERETRGQRDHVKRRPVEEDYEEEVQSPRKKHHSVKSDVRLKSDYESSRRRELPDDDFVIHRRGSKKSVEHRDRGRDESTDEEEGRYHRSRRQR
jgi:hypothetical protein